MTTTTTTEDWLAWRNAGLGGSDVAVLFGLSPWKTELELWLEKTGQKPAQPPSRAMRIGKALEPLVIDLWCEQTGGAVIDRDVRVEHRAWPIARGTLDAIVELEGHRLVLEAKTGRSSGWRDGVPPYYAAQAHWYLMLTRLERADVAVMLDGMDLSVFTIWADRDLHRDLLARAQEWWARHVEGRTPPGAVTLADARALRALESTTADEVVLDGEARERPLALADLKAQIKALERDAEALEKALLTDAPAARRMIALDGDRRVTATWVPPATRETLDITALKADHPELCAQYTRVSAVPGYIRIAGGAR